MAGEKEQLKGMGERLEGKAEEFKGELVGDTEAKRQGKLDQLKGNLREAWGNVKEKAEELKRDMER